jgi:hypothetical protein
MGIVDRGRGRGRGRETRGQGRGITTSDTTGREATMDELRKVAGVVSDTRTGEGMRVERGDGPGAKVRSGNKRSDR